MKTLFFILKTIFYLILGFFFFCAIFDSLFDSYSTKIIMEILFYALIIFIFISISSDFIQESDAKLIYSIEELNNFANKSNFIKIEIGYDYIRTITITNGNEKIRGLYNLGFKNAESLVTFFIKNGFNLIEHTELKCYVLQKK